MKPLSLSPLKALNLLTFPIVQLSFHLQHKFLPNRNKFASLLPLQIPLVSSAFAMVTIGRTVMNTAVPTAIPLLWVTLLNNVLPSSVISVTTGNIAANFVPIKTVEFALYQGTLWVTVLLCVFSHPSCLPFMEDPHLPLSSLWPERGLLIKPGVQLYEGGNVTIFILFPHILLISFFSRHYNWRGCTTLNNSFLLIIGHSSIFLSHL